MNFIFDDIMNELSLDNIATEGTNLEAFKANFSPLLKSAKGHIKAGKLFMKSKEYKDARREFTAAKASLSKLRSEVAAIPETKFSNFVAFIAIALHSLIMGTASALLVGKALGLPVKELIVPTSAAGTAGALVGTGIIMIINAVDNHMKDKETHPDKDIKNIMKKDVLLAIDNLSKYADTLIRANDENKIEKSRATESSIEGIFEEILGSGASRNELGKSIIYECLLDGLSDQLIEVSDLI